MRIILSIMVATSMSVYFLTELESHNDVRMSKLPKGLSEFKISDEPPRCVSWKQYMPTTRDPAAYRIYMAARKLWRSKVEWQLTRDEAMRILEGVGEAAKRGDWGARALMARFHLQGLGVLDSNTVLTPSPVKAVEIIRSGAEFEQPWALYDLGVAYQYGYGGVPLSERIAWAYFAKAAQRGSPEAHLALAKAFGNARQLEKQDSMRMCAFKQRFGPAASLLAGNRRAVVGDFSAAIAFYQEGVKFGDRDSALSLGRLFSEGYWPHMGIKTKGKLEALGITPDSNRSNRYQEIADALEINPDLKFTRLDEVLPLPPAELPSGKKITDALELETDGPPTY